MSMITSTVLVVDDEESIRDLVRTKLNRGGRHVLLAARGEEAVEMFRRHRPDITILDLKMPGMSGIEVLRQIRRIDPRAVVIIFTGCDIPLSAKEMREATELGVTEFVQKGFSLPDV
jgi:CheY-like chemotaxis protein